MASHPDIAICRVYGGGGNRTRVLSHPETAGLQDVRLTDGFGCNRHKAGKAYFPAYRAVSGENELLPEKVETRQEQIAVRDQVAELIAWAAETDDLASLNENMRRDQALQKLVDDVETLHALMRGLRWLEVHAGRVLDMNVRPGRPLANHSRGHSFFSQPDESKFRQLARWTIGEHEHREIVDLVDEGAGRNQILRRIAELTPRGEGEDRWEGLAGRWVVAHADFREFCGDIPAGSVDMVMTDPPYPTEHLHLFGDLAEHAARLLNPRGIAFVLTGKLHLPDVVAHLGRHLNYGWAFMLDLPGANSRIMGRHIVQTWKPILAYTPGTWPAGQWGHDRVVSPRPDQSQHAWAQNAEPMRELIRRYTRPNAIILDPFCGSGAYGCAALLEGRRFIGIDIHADAVATARARLEAA